MVKLAREAYESHIDCGLHEGSAIKLQCREGERHDRTVMNFSDRSRKYKSQKFNKC